MNSTLTRSSSLQLWSIVVFSPVMHHKLIIHEKEAVGTGCPWVRNERRLPLIVELGHAVDYLPGVRCARNHERQLEVIAPDELIAEVVSLDHAEIVQWLVTDTELQGGADAFEIKERWPKVVLDEAVVIGGRGRHGRVTTTLANFEEYLVRAILDGADLEAGEIYAIFVRRERAEEALGRLRKGVHVLWRDGLLRWRRARRRNWLSRGRAIHSGHVNY